MFAASGGVILASALAVMPVTPAAAQEPGQKLEEITVTGSRIVRQDFEANAPIVTIDEATFQSTSTIGVETVLNQLPQFVPAVTQFTTVDVQNTATNTVGASFVSLRGLGANRNLVLIDGKRGQPVNATMAVDTNSIPAAAIKRVEIISGGASAVYGADAVGGVVNFILNDDFEGASVDFRVGDTEHGGNQETTLSALLGAALPDDRGNVMIAVERSTRSKQFAWERDWRVADYANPNVPGTAFFPTDTWISNDQNGFGGNAPSQAAINSVFSQAPAGSVGTNTNRYYLNRSASLAGATVFTGLDSDGFGVFSPAAGAYKYTGEFDRDPYGRFQNLPFRKRSPNGGIEENSFWQWSSIPLERLSSFARGEFDLSDSVRATAQAIYSRTQNETSLGLTSDAIGVWGAAFPFGTTLYAPSVTSLGADGLPNTADAGENMATRSDFLAGGRYGLTGCPAVGGCTESQAWPVPPEIVTLMSSRANPQADLFINRPLDFLREALGDARSSKNVTDTMQLALGLEGELPSGSDFWDVTLTTGRTNTINRLGGAARLNQWRALIASPNFGKGFVGDPNPATVGFAEGRPTCTSGLPVVQVFQVSNDCIEAMAITLQNQTEIRQTALEANLAGDLAEMKAGPLSYALGTTYREAAFSYLTDNLTQNESFTDSVMGLFPTTDSAGEFDVSEIYGELLVPIVKDGPAGVKEFGFELGARYSDWSMESVGALESYKALLNWTVMPKYRIRGGWNRAHRAPNLGELFSGRTQLFSFGSSIFGDPCSQNNARAPYGANGTAAGQTTTSNGDGAAGAANALQVCQGLMGAAGAATYYGRALNLQPSGIPLFGTTQSVGTENTTGNPNLQEERADTFTLGVVMDFLENWTLSVDYYDIEIEDMIAVANPDISYRQCLSLATNPTGDASSPFCAPIVRDPTNGNTATIDRIYSNQGRAEVEGVDFQLNWSKQLDAGGLNLNIVANYNLSSTTQDTPTSTEFDWTGTSGCGLQIQCQGYDYRLFSTIGYFRGPWSFSLRHQYWPSILDSSYAQGITLAPNPNGGVHTSYQLFDLSGSYRFGEKYTLRAGIDNLLDEIPPLAGGDPNRAPFPTSPSRSGLGTPGAIYDPLGRQVFMSFTLDF